MREFELLQHVYATGGSPGDGVVIGPGDDMGAVRLGDQVVLVTVDQVADGVHVRVDRTPLELIGRKAIVRNLSDVAAMAARPVGAVAAVSLPRGFGEPRARALFDAMRQTAERYHCPLIGGDISIWDHPLVVTVTVFAESAGLGPVRRSGAQAGDAVFVTGELGAAWNEQGGGVHLTAEPRIDVARTLAERFTEHLHSMIDLSDGLGRDLGHICEMSNVSALIDAETVPRRAGAELAHALGDGEDYELCFTVDARAAADMPEEIEGVNVTRIGEIRSADGGEWGGRRIALRRRDGSEAPLDPGGWEHRG